MKNIFTLLLLIIILSGCATLGTRTVYISHEKYEFNKIGFVDFSTKDTVHKELNVLANRIYHSTVRKVFHEMGFDTIFYINDKLDYFNPDTGLINKICLHEDIDGLILSTIKFVYIKPWTIIPSWGLNYDTKVETKLFNKKGKMIIFTKHNTHWGNSYFIWPSADITVYDGTIGSIKRMASEIKTLMNLSGQ